MSDYDAADTLLEPTKHDPLNPGVQKQALEEVMTRYQSIARRNPFGSSNAFREMWRNGQHHTEANLSSAKLNDNEYLLWVSPADDSHPALRSAESKDSQPSLKLSASPSASPQLHRRTESVPWSPQISESSCHSPTKPRPGLEKSFSDPAFFPSEAPRGRMSRSLVPAPLSLSNAPRKTRSRSPVKQVMPVIREQEDLSTNRKVQIRESEDGFQVINNSPRKQLFGEKGILHRTETPPSRSKKLGLSNWSGKLKQRLEDMSRDVTSKVANSDASQGPSPPPKDAHVAITLSAYVQANLYMQLELLLQSETNEFLLREARKGRLSPASVKSVSDTWRSKGRPNVVGFSYDLGTQRELVSLNVDTLDFAGVTAFNRIRGLSVLASWKVLAKEISVRTFCQPDSAIKKHFVDAEKILELVDADEESMNAFQELKGSVSAEIYRREKAERERKYSHPDEMP